MKAYLKVIIALALLPGPVFAQEGLNEELNSELDQLMVDISPKANSKKGGGNQAQSNNTVTSTELSVPGAGGGQGSGQPIVILNTANPNANAQNQASQVQKQPTVNIEAAPLENSRADLMRKKRQETELD
jgi:hypothetical protein